MNIREKYDVVVVGGGTAGSIAAISAARTGAKTLIIEKYGRLGGILSTGMTLNGVADGEGYLALGGIGGELFKRLKNISGATRTTPHPLYGSFLAHQPELTQLTLVNMLQESGVNFLLHSFVTDVLMKGSKIEGILLTNKNGLEIVLGENFVDCTGDADLVARANGPYVYGRSGDSHTQPVTLIFRIGGVKLEEMWKYLESHPEDMRPPKDWEDPGESYNVEYLRKTAGINLYAFQNLIKKAKSAGEWNIPNDRLGMDTFPDSDIVTINVTRIQGVDGTSVDDITRAEIEGQRQMYEAVRFLKRYVPGFEKSYITSVPYQIGIRETRHIVGEYVLNDKDILTGKKFNDVIGRGAYPLDIHDVNSQTNALGKDVSGRGIDLHKIDHSYEIPARCLIPRGMENLAVGGRAISATHEAAAAIRGQAVCMVTGHAAGTMAALATVTNTSLSELPIPKLQSVLRSQEVILERNVRIDAG
ncbi:FAD-dependent oxidoreductase [Bacillaceae bacterium CLA-AA-H227]|uniref:FAD-dependent oxidoreductase n=1 Tax=Robertmurraya yapensis (ex Hitch et al 2024) TaxID=3133160 RepID=A0ACC6SII5_9BACI